MNTFVVTRSIGIDAGHRIMTHGSKCKHLHGHRYTIDATCEAIGGELHGEGEQTDMVVDFGFLKDEMMKHIDEPCDHGLILSIQDEEVLKMFAPENQEFSEWLGSKRNEVVEQGFCETTDAKLSMKLYLADFQPTAESLAHHWFRRLSAPVHNRSSQMARLLQIKVWETPNCSAEYSEPQSVVDKMLVGAKDAKHELAVNYGFS